MLINEVVCLYGLFDILCACDDDFPGGEEHDSDRNTITFLLSFFLNDIWFLFVGRSWFLAVLQASTFPIFWPACLVHVLHVHATEPLWIEGDVKSVLFEVDGCVV